MQETAEPTFIEDKALTKRIKCSTSTINRLEKAGKFPRRIKIGKRKKVWLTSEILEWEENQVAARKFGGGDAFK